MAIDLDQFSTDVKEVTDDLPTSFRFKGTTLTGSTGDALDSQVMLDGGYGDRRSLSLLVRKSAFDDLSLPLPVENDLIEIDGVRYRVASISTADKRVYEFTLTQSP